MLDYTAAYRAENDPLADFISECCDLADDLLAPGGDLRAAYETWAEASGEEPVSKSEFRTALRGRGLEPARVGGKRVRVWRGIGLAG